MLLVRDDASHNLWTVRLDEHEDTVLKDTLLCAWGGLLDTPTE